LKKRTNFLCPLIARSEKRARQVQFIPWGRGDEETTAIDDKALAAVDRDWCTAREIYAILRRRVHFNGSGPDAARERWQDRTTT
jgi:hypothetical protein